MQTKLDFQSGLLTLWRQFIDLKKAEGYTVVQMFSESAYAAIIDKENHRISTVTNKDHSAIGVTEYEKGKRYWEGPTGHKQERRSDDFREGQWKQGLKWLKEYRLTPDCIKTP